MFNNFFYPHLRRQEKVMRIIQKHWSTEIPLFLWILFLMTILITSGKYLLPYSLGRPVFVFLVTVVIFYALRGYIKYHFDRLFITTERIINVDQLGFFMKNVEELPLGKVLNVSYSIHGFFHSIFSIGTLHISSGLEDGTMDFHDVHRPFEAQSLILELQQQQTSYSHIKEGRGIELDKIVDKITAMSGQKYGAENTHLWDEVLLSYLIQKRKEKEEIMNKKTNETKLQETKVPFPPSPLLSPEPSVIDILQKLDPKLS